MTNDVGDARVPSPVRWLAKGRPVRPVWRNVLGGITYEIGTDPDRCFVKWLPIAEQHRLVREAERLSWISGRAAAPTLLSQGSDEVGAWMVTAALSGRSAVAPEWLARPDDAVRAIGEGLRALHDSMPVDECPFSWSAPDRLEIVRARLGAGEVVSASLQLEFRGLTFDEILRRLENTPPVDRLVVCHGDACAPNTLLDDSGQWSGHVDLGGLGVADRWADLAVATWSTTWNYGPGWEERLLVAYGIEEDIRRTEYYRLLWDLGP